ncbi:hypothetical protein HYPSUDRAFT_90920 [Hypholoma sublateritium FD-334 SS-4]|uniref:Uncharacterized protein n=1 Tax=Hypholoma sublateritium (strain FD-334 SS-4) TaxID=945553 RepID=A0A0D2P9S2_HYPSF|nr:hypothetical protein HYPSUDRAFT_90920 [Hypholoma sublateritium FD-334 SS-4]
MRPLALHASALSDAEYDLYTNSLRDIALADDDGNKEDAYFEKISVGVREARAWLRGRYSHIPAPVIDGILRLFSPTLGPTDTISGSEFFAVLRLVVHAESGKDVDRSLAFVQADPSSRTRSTPAPSPAKRPVELPPRRPNPEPTAEAPQPPPLHPSQRSESGRSQHSSHNPFTKTPPLPPRKPAPPIPTSSRSISPSKRVPMPARPNSPLGSRAPPLSTAPYAPPPPPKAPQHVTSTLMKQSLQASKVAQTMKRAEAQLEKERVMQVLKRSAPPPPPVHVDNSPPPAATGPARVRTGYDVSSASSASGSRERSAPPLPRRRTIETRHPPPSPPFSATSMEQVARAGFARNAFRAPSDASRDTSPVRGAAPPPTHPDRKPPPAPGTFDAVYGGMGMGTPPSPHDGGSPTARVFRSQSMHHPSTTRATGAPPAVPPPLRRRRPESVQVVGSGVGSLVQAYNNQTPGTPQRRASLSATGSPTQDATTPFHGPSTSAASPFASPAAATPPRALASLQRTFAGLQPRLDSARYKAEAGLARRGFVPGSGAGEEGAALISGHTHTHAHGSGAQGHALRQTHRRAPSDDAPGVDGASSASTSDDDDGAVDDAWRRARGMDVRAFPRRERPDSDVFADGAGGVYAGPPGAGEQDNLKWPAGEGWRPL